MEKVELTDGIDIKEWQIQLPDSTYLTYSMWDFAGQSVYYNTHQFFFSQRAIYVLVWNVRLGSEYAGLEFWLSSISCHAPGAPIFVVGTHIDQVSKYFLNQKSLKMRFPQIEGFFFVSNSSMKGVGVLAKKLVAVTLQQNYIGEKIPETWFNFETAIKAMSKSKALISFSELVQLAEASSLFSEQEILQATRFLNDLGTVQYFESTGLKDYIVINPQWIVSGS
jgi:leucine-rich repeat kinase 2